MLYHGSLLEIDELDPTSDKLDRELVFLTKNRIVALLHICPFDSYFFDLSIVDEEFCQICERCPWAFEVIYKNKSGFLYTIEGDNFEPTNKNLEFVSRGKISPKAKEHIADLYAELLRYQSSGNIEILRFHDISKEERSLLDERFVEFVITDINANNSIMQFKKLADMFPKIAERIFHKLDIDKQDQIRNHLITASCVKELRL